MQWTSEDPQPHKLLNKKRWLNIQAYKCRQICDQYSLETHKGEQKH